MDILIRDRHLHPVYIFRYIFKYLILLILPLIRGLFYIRTPEGLYQWVKGTWMDLVTVLLILLFSFLTWKNHTYTLNEDGFIIRDGIIFRRESFIPRGSISTLCVENPFYLRPFGAVRVSIDTDAGLEKRMDFQLTVGRERAKEILQQRQSITEEAQHIYRPRWYNILILSLLMSNSVSGTLLVSAAFRQTGQILGNEVQQRLLTNLEDAADYVHIIPRTAAMLALVLLVGWTVAAARNMLRYYSFRVYRYPGALTIHSGFLTTRRYSCTASSVNFVDYRQSMISKLFHLHMVFINCIGYGKEKNSMSVLIPMSRAVYSEWVTHHLLPEFHRQAIRIKAAPMSIYRYVFYPLWIMLLLYPVSRILQHFFPGWSELIYYLTFMAFIPCVWQFLLKIIDRFTAGVAHANGFYTLRYSRMYTFHTVIIPEDKMVYYTLKQTFFQKLAKNCDVLVYTYNEGRTYHRIKNIRLRDAQELFSGMYRNSSTKKTR